MATPADLIGRGATGDKPAAGIAGRLYYDTTLDKLQRDSGSAWEDCEPTAGSTGGGYDYILLRDEKTQSTQGGTFTSGAWRTRTLNTEAVDTGNHASLSSNQITLDAGSYEIHAIVPAFRCDNVQARLWNITDNSLVLLSPTSACSSPGATENHIIGRFVLAAQTVLEIQQQCLTTRATDGFGCAATFGTEIYTVVELKREK